MREGGSINGRTDSIKDSVDFDPIHSNVGSLAYVNSQKPSPVSKNQKRESIYKAALLSQLKSSNFEELAKMSHSQSQSSADSQSEGTYSEDEEIPEEFPKKSRFGPKN